MGKKHFKRLTAPRTWKIERKKTIFITRPNPGAHKYELGMPINLIFKDLLNYCKTSKEVKAILNDKDVLVDGTRRKDPRFIVGFMDVFSIPVTKEDFRMILDKKGKLSLIKIKKNEADVKISKIKNKKIIGKNKIQLNLSDGRNILLKDDKYRVSDSLVIKIPEQEIKEAIKLEKGAFVILIGGKHMGLNGEVEEIKENTITVKIGDEQIQTKKDYAFAVGHKKAAISLVDEK
jgi:small subunit ribosomal protein S4e